MLQHRTLWNLLRRAFLPIAAKTEVNWRLHKLLRRNSLRDAVAWVLKNCVRELNNYPLIRQTFAERDPEQDVRVVATELAAYLLVTGDHLGARLALSFVDPARSKVIESCRIFKQPDECFAFEEIEVDSPYTLEPFAKNAAGVISRKRRPLGIAKIPGGKILGLSFIAVTEGGDTCLDWFVHNSANVNKIVNGEDASGLPVITSNALLACLDGVDDYEEGILIGNHDNFGHWLLNHLSRLALVSTVRQLQGIPLVVGEDIKSNHLECLYRFGFKQTDLIRLKKGRLAQFKRLWVPMMPFCATTNALWWAPAIVDFIRKKLGIAHAAAGIPRRRLFITRSNSRWRRLLNEDTILKRLSARGFEVVDPGAISIPQQIELAAHAEVVIGPFGAGMNILLFAPSDAVVIELKYQTNSMDINPWLSERIGQRYKAVFGTPEIMGDNRLNYDFVVAPDQIESALDEMGVKEP
jgi:hypothetical protein